MRKRTDPLVRFWRHVNKTDGCWKWTGAESHGYGIFPLDGVQTNAHRASWILNVGPIPDGLFVCHRCDNRICVRPSHLFLGTQQDNMDDMRSKRREARGERHGRSRLTQELADRVRVAYQLGEPVKDIAAYFGISEASVSLIGRGKRWTRTLTDFSPGRYRRHVGTEEDTAA